MAPCPPFFPCPLPPAPCPLSPVPPSPSPAATNTSPSRLLHTRIFLYRPALVTFYKAKSHKATNQTPDTPTITPSLSSRLLKECAAMCIEAAQSLTSLVAETLDPGSPIGLLPWWYRVYYLHVAGTTFLASMLTPDLFTPSVSQSWEEAMVALRAHEHLSVYVGQCVVTFETLSGRILETRWGEPCGGGASGANGFFEDIFQDVGFDFDSFLFGGEGFVEGV